MSSFSSSVFDNLPTRPPTPPRDTTTAVEDALTFPTYGHDADADLKQKARGEDSNTGLWPHSPPGSQDPAGTTSTGKRVGFTPNPTYHHIACTGHIGSPSAQLRKRRSSAKYSKPLRSILKQATQPPLLTPDDLEARLHYFSPHEPGSFARMLNSAITQLAGSSVPARLDAYLALNGALRTYDSIPDNDALIVKMSLLMQFLTRDMAWKNNHGTLDTNIVTQAIKLTSTIMSDRRLAAALDDDFRSFVIDRSIAVIEHAVMPKAIVKNHMMLLAQQRFSAKAMTPGLADRTITALATVEDRCSGNTVIGTRLVTYQRLLEQAPAVMLHRMRDWFDQVLHGMLSSIKDIRIRAIETCTVAGLTLGNQPHASRTLLDILQIEVDDGTTFGDYLDLRLMQMVASKDAETGACVPEIWSAVVLFFRNKRFPIERWPKFKAWLKLIQRCLNASDLTIKHHAHLAWNKLIFVVMPDASTPRILLDMLKIPVTSGLDRRANDDHTKQARQFALNTYLHLLHYALRPGLSHEELDVAWDVFVDPVLSGLVKMNSYGCQLASDVLRGLCSTSPGIWNVNAANEPQAKQPEQLPRLDPRWVRSRFKKILKPMQTILATATSTPEGANPAYGAAWRTLMQSLADAGIQEVKTSNDLKEALALVYDLCRVLWHDRPESTTGTTVEIFTERYTSILSAAVGCIGAGPFAEEFLTWHGDDKLQVASTPSHRHSKHHSTPRSPFVLLFGLLYHPPTWLQQLESLTLPASRLLALQTSSRPSPSPRIELLAKSAQIWSTGYASDAEPLVAARLWQCLAEEAKTIFETPGTIDDNNESQSLGLDLRHASTILNQGLKHASTSDQAQNTLLEMYSTMISTARRGASIGGTIVTVTELFAKTIHENATSTSLRVRLGLTSYMLSTAAWPRSAQDLDQARKSLWGVGLGPHKTLTFDPYDHLYRLLVDGLRDSYDELDDSEAVSVTTASGLLRAGLSFLKACPLSLLAVALRKTQGGFVPWVADGGRKTGGSQVVLDMVNSSWTDLVRLMEDLPHQDIVLLNALEPMLVAGFSSPHKSIVNDTVLFWNAILGVNDALDYPQQLAKVLRARAAETEVIMFGFPEDQSEDDEMVLPAFYETQVKPLTTNERPRTTEHVASEMVSRGPASLALPRSVHIASEGSPRATPLRSDSSTKVLRSKQPSSRLRLRHDDSQIDFAPVESSPALPTAESQLTEHQREVRVRQQNNAQMFPDLSSSPIVRSSAPFADITKRLDFGAKPDKEPIGTPKKLHGANALMSDDITSSPTPSSNKEVGPAQINQAEDEVEVEDDELPVEEDEMVVEEANRIVEKGKRVVEEDEMTEDETAQDPPSSPPPQAEKPALVSATHDGVLGEPTDPAAESEESSNGLPEAGEAKVHDVELDSLHEQESIDPDLPSDTPLPNEQLQQEVEQAAKESKLGDTTEGTTFFVPHASESHVPRDEGTQDDLPVEQSQVADTVLLETTRIEESFVHLPASSIQDVEERELDSQHSQRSTRKRKSPPELTRAVKKRKQHSPLKAITGFFSSFVSGSQQQDEDDDDMEEEIVVVHSAPSSAKKESPRRMTSPAVVLPLPPAEHTVITSSEMNSQASGSQSKRQSRRGKARNERPASVASLAESSTSQNLKRKASQFDDSAAVDGSVASVVEDTPAPAKVRKQRHGIDSHLVRAARLSQEATELGRSTRRSTALSPRQDPGEQEEDEAADGESAVDEDQSPPPAKSALEAALPSCERVPASPRTILGRLKDVLADLPRMILGPQDERELDDVLFEVRREVFEAGRRGRQ
ncbi:hypothetical protein LTR35_011518 [Friedmanniomyces endolithicus]|nr:hypothetical protein LTR35_011518 [Friedmanniomyces endolithicus]KAK0288377.1 hypothetical protein LTS00_009587 [Friedmanniomyces endolithicus]KAK1017391.1 hypothetical protein LTR54_002768 [Friedmanniomyces endolithicus]